jgi:hypothetical protein
VIYIGIDDTDIVGSPGTNQLARAIVKCLGPTGENSIVCRHQLFFDPRVPYTSKNGSASIQLPRGEEIGPALIDRVRDTMRAWYVEGSDPGLAVAAISSPEMAVFAARAKTEVVSQSDARTVAAQAGCHLEGLGGTEQGIIGRSRRLRWPRAATTAGSSMFRVGRGRMTSADHKRSRRLPHAALPKSVLSRASHSPAGSSMLASASVLTGAGAALSSLLSPALMPVRHGAR